MKMLVALMLTVATMGTASAESAVEKQCASGKCTCTYIASTCKDWNSKHGGDLAACEGYRQSCLSSGRWDDRNRHIDIVVKK